MRWGGGVEEAVVGMVVGVVGVVVNFDSGGAKIGGGLSYAHDGKFTGASRGSKGSGDRLGLAKANVLPKQDWVLGADCTCSS